VELFVVVDLMGSGRVVGVFDSERAAARVVGEFGEYYRITRCRINRIDPDVVDWARTDAQRDWLQKLVDEQG